MKTNYPKRITRNVTDLATGQVTVTSTPQQINYVQEQRIGTKLTNLSATVEFFYGSTQGVSSTTGDLVPAGRGQWISIPCQSVIWVVCAPGSTGLLSWADAYDYGNEFD